MITKPSEKLLDSLVKNTKPVDENISPTWTDQQNSFLIIKTGKSYKASFSINLKPHDLNSSFSNVKQLNHAFANFEFKTRKEAIHAINQIGLAHHISQLNRFYLIKYRVIHTHLWITGKSGKWTAYINNMHGPEFDAFQAINQKVEHKTRRAAYKSILEQMQKSDLPFEKWLNTNHYKNYIS